MNIVNGESEAAFSAAVESIYQNVKQWLKAHQAGIEVTIYVVLQGIDGLLGQIGISQGLLQVGNPALAMVSSMLPVARASLGFVAATLMQSVPNLVKVFILISVVEGVMLVTTIAAQAVYNQENAPLTYPGAYQALPDSFIKGLNNGR